jgi:hypothetical protein
MVSAQDEGGCHSASGERDMKDSSRVCYRKLGDESGDTGDGIGSTWLDARYGEWVVTGGAAGAERGVPLCHRTRGTSERAKGGMDIGNEWLGR